MTVNEFGFPTSGTTGQPGDKIGHKQVTNTALSATLPQKALERISYFMAWRVIGLGHRQGYLSNANGALSRFHERIMENYHDSSVQIVRRFQLSAAAKAFFGVITSSPPSSQRRQPR